MILLQAAMAEGAVLVVLLAIFLLAGIFLLGGFFMKMFWRATNKHDHIKNKIPYYKDPIPFFFSIAISILIAGGVFFWLITWFDNTFPGHGFYN